MTIGTSLRANYKEPQEIGQIDTNNNWHLITRQVQRTSGNRTDRYQNNRHLIAPHVRRTSGNGQIDTKTTWRKRKSQESVPVSDCLCLLLSLPEIIITISIHSLVHSDLTHRPSHSDSHSHSTSHCHFPFRSLCPCPCLCLLHSLSDSLFFTVDPFLSCPSSPTRLIAFKAVYELLRTDTGRIYIYIYIYIHTHTLECSRRYPSTMTF